MTEKKLVFYSLIASVALVGSGLLYFYLHSDARRSAPAQQSRGIIVGNPDAPLLIKEYVNFLCPACASFANNVMPRLEAEYLATGKVKMEFVLYPPFETAEAGVCANEQNKFMPFHDYFFKHQREFKDENDLGRFAEAAGLNKTLFQACLNSKKYEELVKNWLDDGQAKGVDGTPTFFIGDENSVVPGSFDYSIFKDLLDKKLNQ